MSGMRYQPQGRARLDRSNILGARVIEHISLNGQARTLVAGQAVNYGPGGITQASPKGRSLRGQGTGPRATVALDLSAHAAITIAFWLYWDAYANDDALAMEFGPLYAGGDNGFLVDPNNSNAVGGFMWGVGGGGSNLSTFPRPAAGRWHRILLTMNRTAAADSVGSAYVNGVAQPITPYGGNSATFSNFGTADLNLFSRNGQSLFGTGHLQDLTIYSGLLTAAEAAQDFQNPWQIFAAEDEDWAPDAAGYGLGVTPATLSVTGGQVSMKVSRVLRAQPAGLALAGGPVLARSSRRLSVQPAALGVMAGQVRMAVSRRLGVQPAALALARQGVMLRAGRRLQVAPVSLAVAGGQVGMQYAPAPQPGSYTLSVSAAAITLGGGQVGMRVSRRLRLLSAVFTVAGGMVGMRHTGEQEDIDAFLVPARQTVVFEGSRRIVVFEGSQRVVAFEGGKRVVSFE